MTHGRKYGEKESYPLPVWNGVLDHRERIAHAIWEFLWCLDKITEEVDGIGRVFGGAPVKIPKIAADLHQDEKTVRLHLSKLEEHGYIRRTRTPYGFVIGVVNSRKFEIWHPRQNGRNARSLTGESTQSCPICPAKMPDLSGKNARNKEDAAIDAAIDAASKRACAVWEATGVDPQRVPGPFRKLCEDLWPKRDGQSLSAFLGACMDGCQAMGWRIPGVFAQAKARAVEQEKAQLGSLPELEAEPWQK